MNTSLADAPLLRWRTFAFVVGYLLFLLGILVLLGWRFDLPAVKTVFPGLAPMKPNTALLFLLSGVSLAANAASGLPRGREISHACALAVLAIGILTLLQRLTGRGFGIDELLFPDPDTPPHLHPGRMSWATNLAFLLASAALLMSSMAQRKPPIAKLARLCTVGVVAIGLVGLIGYSLHFDLLYASYAYHSIALHTAAGLVALGIGIWACGEDGAWAHRVLAHDERVARAAAWLLAFAAGVTGITGFAALELQVENILARGLRAALDAGTRQIVTTVRLRSTNAEIIASRPNLLKHLRLLATDPGNAEYRLVVQGVIESFAAHDFSVIRILLPDGQEVGHLGGTAGPASMEIRLDRENETSLVWRDGLYLRHRLLLRDAQGLLGLIMAEQPMPSLNQTLFDIETLGESAEMLLCGRSGEALACFPSRLTGSPAAAPRQSDDAPRFVQRMLGEHDRLGVLRDYRGQYVLGAHAPVGALGLVAVFKVDADEVYLPIGQQFQIALLLVILLSASGALLVRRQVQPLVQALEKRADDLAAVNTALQVSEKRFRALLDGAPDVILIVDDEGNITFANARAEAVFGYPPSTLVSQAIEVLIPQRYHDKHAAHRRAYSEAPQTRAMGSALDLYARHADGREIPVDVMLSPIAVAQGSVVMAIVRDVTERKQAEDKIEAALQEKTALLNEVHHRVKNNLQVISSLLNLQANHTQNPELQVLLGESQGRVRAMALIHQLLYERKDFSRVHLGQYLEHLGYLLSSTQGAEAKGIALRVTAAEVYLDLQRAVPFGLLANELVTNAFKHAFPGNRAGEIRIELLLKDTDEVVLVVSDTGIGLPAGLDLKKISSLGLQLVTLLADQVKAKLTMSSGIGARFELRFSALEKEQHHDSDQHSNG
jgi:PAS domain S-box-containing protein